MKSNSHSEDLSNNGSDPFSKALRDSIAGQALPPASSDLRAAILARLDQPAVTPASLSPAVAARRRTLFQQAAIALVGTAAAIMAAVIWQRPAGSLLSWNDLSPPSTVAKTAPATQRDLSSATLLPIGDRFGDTSRHSDLYDAPRDFDESAAFSLEGTKAPPGENAKGLWDRRTRDYASRNETLPYGNMPAGRPSGPVVTTSRSAQPAEYALPEKKEDNSPTATDRRVKGREVAPSDDAPGIALDSSGGSSTGPVSTSSAPTGGTTASKKLLPISGVSGGGAQPAPAATSSPQGVIAGGGREETVSRAEFDKLDKFTKGIHPESGTKGLTELARLDESEKKPREWSEQRGKDVDGFSTIESKAVELAVRAIDDKTKFGDETHHFRYAAPGSEQYAQIVENHFKAPTTAEDALSTFAIDVDTASYANVRRFLNNGQLPPPDAVRIEEFVNYFKYKYPQPKGDTPFSVNLEMADCPWQPGHKLLRVGLQGKEIHKAERPPSNIVFLVDTSGSMTDANKLALLKQSFTLMVGELNENDKVTIVTYAGNAGLRLPPTRGDQKETIVAAIEGMQSGGSTHGSAGIELAYEHAAAQFIKDGTNKVILATDGDLNVGITDDAELIKLITKKAETGVYLTVLGVGIGNLKDAKMERLADNGNGIYAYLDSVREARKVLVEQMSGSLVTIAKDVKIQVEFNPKHIQGYRLLGYENRVMANQDFRNDAKDAGEIGAGHSVTAIYEVALVGAEGVKKVNGETLRYQRPIEKPTLEPTKEGMSDELLTVRLRYKQPDATIETKATEVEFPLKDKGGNFNSASSEFQFASAVAALGLVLRGSEYRGSANLSAVAEIAGAATGEDPNGHRAEFLDLVRKAKALRGN